MFRFGIIIPFHQDPSTDHEKHKLSSIVCNCTDNLPQLMTCEPCDQVPH